jgi:hypothetical protein
MTDKERWERLLGQLQELDIEARLDERTFTGGTYYRPVEKTGYSITVRTADRGLIQIGDKMWNKNLDVWVGYKAHLEGRDGIVKKDMRWTKKRSEVVAWVQATLKTVEVSR